jgi:hypothetical protein
MIRRILLSIAIVSAVFTLAFVVIAGHRPVCCKGYLYWNILEPHGGGMRWRKVKDPITFREVPIVPSIWELGEAKSRSFLFMMAKTKRPAHGRETIARDWDAACWYYGESEPSRSLWPVQP